MKASTIVAAALALLTPAAAGSTELSIKPRVGITVLGFDAPTGGVSAGVDGRVLWKLQESTGLYAGLGADAIGLTGGWYHMGLTAGPRAGGWHQWKSLYVSAGLGLPYGQLSLCRTWEMGARQCMRWWSAWPELSGHIAYRTEDMHVGLDITTMLLRPTWGTDGSIGIAASGSWR